MLMPSNAVDANSTYIVDRRPQPDRTCNVRSSRLEFVRQGVISCFLEAYRGDHISAALIGGHSLQQLGLPVEHPDTGRSVDLVTRERVEIAGEILNIDLCMRRRLSPVNQHWNSSTMCQLDHFANWIYRSQCIGDLSN